MAEFVTLRADGREAQINVESIAAVVPDLNDGQLQGSLIYLNSGEIVKVETGPEKVGFKLGAKQDA